MKKKALWVVASGLVAIAIVASSAGAGTPGGRVFFQDNTRRTIPDAPDGGGVLGKIKVRRSGQIRDLEVGIRIDHTFDADLNIYLVSPKGKFVELSTDNGGSGNNYGTGPNSCRGPGSFTVFDDEAGRSIRGGSAPFAGAFVPQTPLRALDGSTIRGTWRLMVFDDDRGSTGTIGCFAIGAILR